MINFIICEDEADIAREYKNVIDKFMMQYDYEYKCYLFKGYDNKFRSFAEKNKEFKIYILDIKTEYGSGLDAARIIREEIEDWNSMIIMITSFNEYKYDALSKRLMLLDFINKMDNYKLYLKDSISRCIKYYDNKPNKLRYTYKNVIYNIEFKNIVIINKKPDSKICHIIVEGNKCIPFPGTINELDKLLDKRFIKTSRSTIVNSEKISRYDITENIIYFNNNLNTTSISRDKKRSIIKYVRGIE